MKTPRENTQNQALMMAKPAMVAPAMPNNVANMKPLRRPIARINCEAGIVAAMTPAWCTASGSVAMPLSSASNCPISGLVVIISDVPLI